MNSDGTSPKDANERDQEAPVEPRPGPPELQHLLRRMQSSEDGTGTPPPSPQEPELDLRLMYTTTFLQLVLIPAILFGPVLSYPSNTIACFSSGGLAIILAYLELQNRQRGFAMLSFGIGLFLLLSGVSRWMIGTHQSP